MRTHRRFAALWALVLAIAFNPIVGKAQGPSISQGGILNAASLSGDPSNIAAPGSLITILGKNLATETATPTTSPRPLTLNGTLVQIGSLFAPLTFISPTQINAQIPFEITPETTQAVVVWQDGHPSNQVSLRVKTTAPGIFTVAQNGAGPARVLHADGSAVSNDSPASPGEEVLIFTTGLGVTLSSAGVAPLKSGELGNGQPTLAVPTVNIGGVSATVISSVAGIGVVGQYVIRVVVPAAGTAGAKALVVSSAGNTTAAGATIAVGQAGQTVGGGGGGGGGGTGPVIFTGGIVNAASLDLSTSDTAAPGSLISIFGTNLATGTASAGAAPLPRALGGTSVVIGTVAAPLLLVSPSQINAQVPLELQPGSPVTVTVIVNGRSSAAEPLNIVPAAPGVFTLTGSGGGTAEAFHFDGTLVGNDAPALPGELLSIFTTGMGTTLSTANLPAVKTGEAGSGQLTLVTPSVTIGGKDAGVFSSAAAPGVAGQYIIKAYVPDLLAGDKILIVSAAGATSRGDVILRVGSGQPTPPRFTDQTIQGSFTANFGLKVLVPDPSDISKEIITTAIVTKTVPCVINLLGIAGPNYTASVHCQDYTTPQNLLAVIVGMKDGKIADNKLVFTNIADSAINHFFYVGPGTVFPGTSLSRTVLMQGESAVTAVAMSIDLSNVDSGASVLGTLNVTLALDKIEMGGSILQSFAGGGPVISSGGILNAASLAPAPNNATSPGGLISIFGAGLASGVTTGTPVLAASPDLPSVKIGTFQAPLLLVSPTQINAQVPFEVVPGTTYNVVVTVNGRASLPEPLRVVAAAPGVFTTSANGTGAARILHANLSPVTNASPAIPGEQVLIFATGMGATLATSSLPAVQTGEAGQGQATVTRPLVTIGGRSALVINSSADDRTSSGAAPGLIGQYLIKVAVPATPGGDQTVTVAAAGNDSQTAALVRVGFPQALPPTFSQMRVGDGIAGSGNGTYFFGLIFPITVKVPAPTTEDPTATKTVDTTVNFSQNLACTIDLSGSTGPLYSAVVECRSLLPNGLPDPTDLTAIKVFLKDGNFINNEIVFPRMLDDPGTNNFFFLNATRLVPIPKAIPGALSISEAQSITSAVMSLDFTSLTQGSPVVGTLHFAVSGKVDIGGSLITHPAMGGTLSGAITSVQP